MHMLKKGRITKNNIRKWTKVQICVYKNKDFNQQKRKVNNNKKEKEKKEDDKIVELCRVKDDLGNRIQKIIKDWWFNF